jgi:hypothetical protein
MVLFQALDQFREFGHLLTLFQPPKCRIKNLGERRKRDIN